MATSARNPDERQGLWVTTDADGLWALADLQPGGFTVSDPGTPAATEARRISLRMGQEAANTNFNLSTARYASVSGTVVGSSGAPVGATVTLRTADASDLVAFPSVSATGRSVHDSQRRSRGLSHTGTHGGRRNPKRRRRHGIRGTAESIDGQDVSGLVIATAPGANASGRVTFEGTAEPAGRLFVRTLPMTPGAPGYLMASAGVNPDSTFEARALAGRQAFDIGTLPPGWFLKSVMHQGRDITESGYDFKPGQSVSGIQIIVSQTATTLSGTGQDDAARPVSEYTVVAFSADSSKWGYRTRFVRSVRPDQHGRFTLRGLPRTNISSCARIRRDRTGERSSAARDLERNRHQGDAGRWRSQSGDVENHPVITRPQM